MRGGVITECAGLGGGERSGYRVRWCAAAGWRGCDELTTIRRAGGERRREAVGTVLQGKRCCREGVGRLAALRGAPLLLGDYRVRRIRGRAGAGRGDCIMR